MIKKKRKIVHAKLKLQIIKKGKKVSDEIQEITMLTLGETTTEVTELMYKDKTRHSIKKILKEFKLSDSDIFKIIGIDIISEHGLTSYEI